MVLDHVKVRAAPHFVEATCPKCRADMIELQNGWFSVCWYCQKCEIPFELEMRKMRKVNWENLNKFLVEKGLPPSSKTPTEQPQ